MSNSMQDRVNNELKKAQEKGSLRFKKVQEIFKNAFNQTIEELKEGSSEIRTHIKDAGFAAIRTPENKQTVTENNLDRETVPVVVDIIEENPTEEPVIAPVVVVENTTENETIAPVVAEETITETITPVIVDNTPTQVEVVEVTDTKTDSLDLLPRLEEIFRTVVDSVKEGKVDTLRQQLTQQFDEQWQKIDAKLLERYGNRYTEIRQNVKQYWQNAKLRYEEAKAKIDAGEPSVLQRKQVEIDAKCSEAGVSAAKKEAEIKQQVKAAWQAIATKS